MCGMRNALFWIILAAGGAVGWVVSVVLAVVSGGHQVFSGAANFFGIMMLVSIPIGLIIELVKYLKNRYGKK